jgi:hypothetical protein
VSAPSGSANNGIGGGRGGERNAVGDIGPMLTGGRAQNTQHTIYGDQTGNGSFL